ncbi:hypothetical protein R1sor_008798 [Riccia sorocarpa]|uniref:Uncharacterized protein n=1 Tax=Riccia sorocarpa TaxID=122646 RepID=A0ABD3HUG4_9MARC
MSNRPRVVPLEGSLVARVSTVWRTPPAIDDEIRHTMAEASQTLRRQKRKSVDSDEEYMEKVRERMTHLELENRFLEERVKMLEAESREERLKCDDCKRQLRECQEHLDKEQKSNAEYCASSRMWHDLTRKHGGGRGIDQQEGA